MIGIHCRLCSSFAGRHYFSTLDCFAGDWQIEMEEASRQYCSFVTSIGTFCFNKSPFGLSNAPSFFQSVMEHIFSEFLYVAIYLDDLGVGSMTEAEHHLVHLKKIFARCLKCGIYLKLSKCSFFALVFRYLGLQMSFDGLSADPSKVTSLLERSPPSMYVRQELLSALARNLEYFLIIMQM
jgi:hypothetical protein